MADVAQTEAPAEAPTEAPVEVAAKKDYGKFWFKVLCVTIIVLAVCNWLASTVPVYDKEGEVAKEGATLSPGGLMTNSGVFVSLLIPLLCLGVAIAWPSFFNQLRWTLGLLVVALTLLLAMQGSANLERCNAENIKHYMADESKGFFGNVLTRPVCAAFRNFDQPHGLNAVTATNPLTWGYTFAIVIGLYYLKGFIKKHKPEWHPGTPQWNNAQAKRTAAAAARTEKVQREAAEAEAVKKAQKEAQKKARAEHQATEKQAAEQKAQANKAASEAQRKKDEVAATKLQAGLRGMRNRKIAREKRGLSANPAAAAAGAGMTANTVKQAAAAEKVTAEAAKKAKKAAAAEAAAAAKMPNPAPLPPPKPPTSRPASLPPPKPATLQLQRAPSATPQGQLQTVGTTAAADRRPKSAPSRALSPGQQQKANNLRSVPRNPRLKHNPSQQPLPRGGRTSAATTLQAGARGMKARARTKRVRAGAMQVRAQQGP